LLGTLGEGVQASQVKAPTTTTTTQAVVSE
jgi:hypothetical protein